MSKASAYWQEVGDEIEACRVPDDVYDVVFKLDGRRLPVDHAQALANAVCSRLETASLSNIGIHQIRVAETGNGWQRPSDAKALLHLSRRTRLVLRVTDPAYQAVRQLVGCELEIDGQCLTLGAASIRKLKLIPTLFSHGVACDQAQSENEFIDEMAAELKTMSIRVKKMICGKTDTIRSDQGSIFTRALMVAELSPQESVGLQQQGIGDHRILGCGLFIPHKGIDAVFTRQD